MNHEEMIIKYRSGKTLAEIAGQCNLSFQRVHKIVRGAGVKAEEGGAHLLSMRRRDEKRRARDQRYIDKKGCTYKEYLRIRAIRSPGGVLATLLFASQRGLAKQRGIKWILTLKQWWDIWEKSGKWDRRGRGTGCYCMARYGDCGPYEVGNVSIVPSVENNLSYHERVNGRIYKSTRIRHGLPIHQSEITEARETGCAS